MRKALHDMCDRVISDVSDIETRREDTASGQDAPAFPGEAQDEGDGFTAFG